MKKKIIWIGIIVLSFFIIFSGCTETHTVESKTIYVDKSYNETTSGWHIDRFASIQEAIDYSTNGTTIIVHSGTYYENIVIDKTINITGENKINTIIDGQGNGYVVVLSSNNVIISGFTIQHSGQGTHLSGISGIYIASDNNRISQNTIRDNNIGIHANHEKQSSNNIITQNTIINNSNDGIYLIDSSNNKILENHISENALTGIYLTQISGDTITGNAINDNHGIGILLLWSNTSTVSANTISNNTGRGIILQGSSNNTILENIIENNEKEGIAVIEDSSDNTISQNTLGNNLYGLIIDYGFETDTSIENNNVIFMNNFINNSQNALEHQSSNMWDNGSKGNYWSDYSIRYPSAIQSDGIWNIPYAILVENNSDRYPLANPSSEIKEYKRTAVRYEFTNDFYGVVNNSETKEYNYIISNQTVDNKTVELTIIMSYTGGDIDLHVMDSLGRHVGENFGPEGSVDKPTIPNSTYNGNSDRPTIVIENPQQGIYTIKVYGTNTDGETSFSVSIAEKRVVTL